MTSNFAAVDQIVWGGSGGWAGTGTNDYLQALHYESELGRAFGLRWRGNCEGYEPGDLIIKSLAQANYFASKPYGFVSANLNPRTGASAGGAAKVPIPYPDIANGLWDPTLDANFDIVKQVTGIVLIEDHSEINVTSSNAQPLNPGSPDDPGTPRAQGIVNWTNMHVRIVNRAVARGASNARWCVSMAGYTPNVWSRTDPNSDWTKFIQPLLDYEATHPGVVLLHTIGVDAYVAQGKIPKTPDEMWGLALASCKAVGKKLSVMETGHYQGETLAEAQAKAAWYLQVRDWIELNKADLAYFAWTLGEIQPAVSPPEFYIDPLSDPRNGKTSPSYVNWLTAAATPAMNLPDASVPQPKTFDEWEASFNRGFEVAQFVHPTHTRTAKTEFFMPGGEEERALLDVGPAAPYGNRHATPLVDIQTAKLSAAGNYSSFNFGWANVVQDAIPAAVTDPAAKAWSAWTETPQTYIKRQLGRAKLLPGAWLLAWHGNPEDDLAAQQASATAQGLGVVTEATFTQAVAKVSQWVDEVGCPNLVGIVLKLDLETYIGTDTLAHDWAKWSNVPSAAFDLFGVALLNAYQTGGTWASFKSMFAPVHQRITAAGKPLIVEAGSTYDPSNLGRRAVWFEEMRGILEGTVTAYSVTETDPDTQVITTTPVAVGRLDVESVLLNTTGAYAPDQLAPPSNTSPDPATVNKLMDVLNDPPLTPGGVTTPTVAFSKSDSAVGSERVVLGKVVSAAVYDGGIYDGGTYDGSLTTFTELFASDSGVGSDVAQPVFGTAKTASDTGSGSDTAVLAVSTSLFLSLLDTGVGGDAVGTLTKGTTTVLTAADTGRGTDFAAFPVVVPDATPLVYDTLYFADPRDPNFPWSPVAVGFDLNDNPTGNGFGWYYEAEIGMGTVPNTPEYISEKPYPGADLATAGLEQTQMTIPLTGFFASVDDLNTAYHKLMRYAERGGVIVWKPRGQSAALYFHIDPSDLPALLDGGERVAHRVYGLRIVMGLQLVLNRQPRVFRAPVFGAPAQMLMRPGQRHIRAFNPGNTPSPMRIRVRPQAGVSFPVQWRAGIYSEHDGDLDDLEARYSGELESSALGAQTTSIAEPKGSNDLVARTLITTKNEARMRRRWRVSLDDVPPGTYRCYVPVSVTADCRLQLRYGLVSGSAGVPAFYERAVVPLTPGPSIASSGDLTEVFLGLVRVPKGTRHVFLEGWASLADTDADVPSGGVYIRWDQYVLMPASLDFATVASPGFRVGSVERTVFSVSAGTLGRTAPGQYTNVDTTGTSFILDDLNEVVFTKPLGGNELDPGRHRVAFHGKLRDPDFDANDVTFPPGRPLLVVEVWDLTVYPALDLANISPFQRPVVSAVVGTKRNRITTEYDKILDFESIPGHLYTYAARYNRQHVEGRQVIVASISDAILVTTRFPDAMVLDGWERDASIRTPANERSWALSTDGYIEAPPGWFDLVFSFAEVPYGDATLDSTDYSTLDERENLGRASVDYLYAVSLELLPAFVAQ